MTSLPTCGGPSPAFRRFFGCPLLTAPPDAFIDFDRLCEWYGLDPDHKWSWVWRRAREIFPIRIGPGRRREIQAGCAHLFLIGCIDPGDLSPAASADHIAAAHEFGSFVVPKTLAFLYGIGVGVVELEPRGAD